MKLTAKVNGVHQEIELSKEDVYVVECGSVDETNSVLKSVDKTLRAYSKWHYVSNKPIFEGGGFPVDEYITDTEPIPPNTPIISFEDWERLMESDKAEPKPTKWRFKTQKEFDDTCEKNEDGWYKCGKYYFVNPMFYLFGKEYAGNPDNLIKHDNCIVTPEMLMPLEEPNNMVPNEPNCGEVKEPAPIQKWEKLTRGGYIEVLDVERFWDVLVVKGFNTRIGINLYWFCNLDGINKGGNENFDLIPFNRESILKEIEEHENKIKELKAKL